MPSASLGDELYNYVFFVTFGLTVLLGITRSIVLFAERRRMSLRRRLATFPVVSTNVSELKSSQMLRRSLVERRLHGSRALPSSLRTRLDAAFAAAGHSIGMLHLILVGIIAAATTIGFTLIVAQLSFGLAIALGSGAALGGPTLLVQWAQSRYQRQFLEVFPDALDLIVRAVRAGLPALEAMDLSTTEIAPPVGTEFRRMLNEMRVGVEMEEALQKTADRIQVPDFRFFVVCLVLQRRTGGRLADTLSQLSTLIRHRRTVRLKARALTAETKASAIVVTMSPLIAVTALFFINRPIMSTLFSDPRGRFMLWVAVFSLLLGIATIIMIIRKGEP
jgi:tight adherence protein B